MAKLTLHLLGGFQAFLEGEPITTFTSDKTRALLAYLVVEAKRIHRRESLCALLWPNVLENSARQSLSQALSILRKALKDTDKARPFLLTDRDTVQFNPESDYELDAERLEIGDWRLMRRSISNLQSLISIYPGPFLNGFTIPDAEGFEEWALLQREALQRSALEQLDKIVARNIEQSHYANAIEAARKQLALDPWREETHRSLMQAYALNGQRSDALAQFEKCRQVLREALGVEPSTETKLLLARIQKDELPGKPATNPALRLHAAALPAALTPFVGRETELHALAEVIANPDARLITLVGAGGMGKTRLAIQVAAQMRDEFVDGAAFVPLATLNSPDALASALASALSLNLYRPNSLREELLAALHECVLLLVLDNFEQLLTEDNSTHSVSFITELLQAALRLKLIITSREALNVPGEWVQDVHGLGADAQALFVQSAQRARVGFVPNAEDAHAIQRICNLVGGMPLGIELAASWTRLLSCAEIVAEIEKNIDFLSTNARQIPARHRSITAVFEHSWNLLTDEERQALMHLALFSGGFTREAANAVAGATLPLLSALVAKSLVRRMDIQTEGRRFELHELIRQFASAHIGNRAQAADAHAHYFAQYAVANGYEALPTDHHTKFAEISRERANLETACAHMLLGGDGLRAAGMIGSLLSLWLSQQSDTAFGLPLVMRTRTWFLQTGTHPTPAVAAQLLAAQVTMLALTADVTDVADELAAALTELCAQSGSAVHTLAYGLAALAWVRLRQGRIAEALGQLEESIAHFRRLNDPFGLAWVLRGLSLVLAAQQRFEAALDAIKECVAICRRLKDPRGLALALGGQGECERAQGDLRNAILHYAESAQLFEALGDQRSLLMCKLNHLSAYIQLGLRNEVEAMTRELARLIAQSGELPGGHIRAYALLNFAGSALLLNDQAEQGAQLLGASLAVLAKHGSSLQPADRRAFEHIREQLAERLSAEQFAWHWRAGETSDDEMLLRDALARWHRGGLHL